MNKKSISYVIVACCVLSILFTLVIALMPTRKRFNTYLALGDYLSVSGTIENENVNSFTEYLGEYLVDNNYVEIFNRNYVESSIDSYKLLEMVSKGAYSGKEAGIRALVGNSKYITISVGLNDIIKYIRFDSNEQKIYYDEDVIKRKLEIMKQNYYEIIEEIKDINSVASIYLVGYYNPFCWVDNDKIDDVTRVFNLLNEAIYEASKDTDVYYVDISGVSRCNNMASRYKIYLNENGQEYIFDLIKNNYF